MQISQSDLNLLAQLADQYLDLGPSEHDGWLTDVKMAHPQLATALAAMVDKSDTRRNLPPMSLTMLADEQVEYLEFAEGAIVGPYRLLRKIGQGGMGVVWLAEQADGQLSRQVALKLPLQRLDPGLEKRGQRMRFLRERQILSILDHPGIAQLFDAGVTEDGQPYMAMQYVSGQNINDYCNQRNLDLAARIKLFIELLAAVQYAHSVLIVHRDIKPGNIIVTEEGRVVLLDFGVAKLLMPETTLLITPELSGGLTEIAPAALTLDYASPEQVANQNVGTGTDIYSLGIVLYELLAGCRPYRLQRASRAAMEEAILDQEILPPSARVTDAAAKNLKLTRQALCRQLKGDLNAILLKALARKPERRYATAREFGSDLEHWLNKEPVSAQPDRIGYRMGRLLRREWKLISALAAVMLILLLTTTLAVLQTIEANRSNLAAQLSSKNAIEEARKAKAVTAFLKDLFNRSSMGQNNPELERKKTAQDLLDDGARRIKAELHDTPELQIEMMHLMAQLYAQMYLPQRSFDIYEQAVTVARDAYGEKSPKTLDEIARQSEYAFAYDNLDLGNQKLAIIQAALPELLASRNIDQLRAAGNIYNALLARNIFHNVRESLDNAWQAEQLYGRLPPEEFTWGIHHGLGVAFFKNFEFDEANKQFLESLRLIPVLNGIETAVGSQHTWYGMLQNLTGQYQLADAQHRIGYSQERRSDSKDHLSQTWCMSKYAKFLTQISRPKEALLLTQTGGPDTNEVIRSQLEQSHKILFARAMALIRLGPVEQGLRSVERAEAIAAKLYGKDAASIIPDERMEAALELGRLDDAKQVLDLAYTELKILNAERSFDSRIYWFEQIRFLIAQHKPQEAMAVLEQARPILVPNGAGLIEQAKLTWLQASIEQQTDNHTIAKQRVEAMLSQIIASPQRGYLREWEARLNESLGGSRLAQNDLAGAEAAYSAALAIYKEIFDPATSLSIGRTDVRLAELYRRTGNLSAMKALLEDADRIKKQHRQFQQWL